MRNNLHSSSRNRIAVILGVFVKRWDVSTIHLWNCFRTRSFFRDFSIFCICNGVSRGKKTWFRMYNWRLMDLWMNSSLVFFTDAYVSWVFSSYRVSSPESFWFSEADEFIMRKWWFSGQYYLQIFRLNQSEEEFHHMVFFFHLDQHYHWCLVWVKKGRSLKQRVTNFLDWFHKKTLEWVYSIEWNRVRWFNFSSLMVHQQKVLEIWFLSSNFKQLSFCGF